MSKVHTMDAGNQIFSKKNWSHDAMVNVMVVRTILTEPVRKPKREEEKYVFMYVQ